MSAAWLAGNVLSFDCETTGTDPLTARIVTAHAVECGAAGAVVRGSWLVNPGVPIPAEATAIHGVTDDMAAKGAPLSTATVEILNVIFGAWAHGLPVVIMNAPYDLTVLRNCLTPLDRFDAGAIGAVLDPLVIDRGCFPYRKGKRTLPALAEFYGVKSGEAHSSDGDALTAARVVWAQARTCSKVAGLTLDEMQAWQRDTQREWATQFQAWLLEQGKRETINTEWPIRRLDADSHAA